MTRRHPTLALLLGVAALAFAACSGSGAGPTSVPTIPAAVQSAAASLASGANTAAVCRDLTNLKSLDYAFGASFSVIQALDAASKAKTLADLQAFAAEAPAEIKQPVTDLAAFWTALSADPNSVTEADARLTGAAAALAAWQAANCT